MRNILLMVSLSLSGLAFAEHPIWGTQPLYADRFDRAPECSGNQMDFMREVRRVYQRAVSDSIRDNAATTICSGIKGAVCSPAEISRTDAETIRVCTIVNFNANTAFTESQGPNGNGKIPAIFSNGAVAAMLQLHENAFVDQSPNCRYLRQQETTHNRIFANIRRRLANNCFKSEMDSFKSKLRFPATISELPGQAHPNFRSEGATTSEPLSDR